MNINNAKRAKTQKRQRRKADAKVAVGSRVSVVELGSGDRLDLKIVASVQLDVQLDEVSSWSPLGKAWGAGLANQFMLRLQREWCAIKF